MANTVSVTKNYIPQIDYVSRDYTAILADLTTVAKQFNPTWAVSDPTDIGVALLETFAYLGDILSFYTDRMASEGFLGTASQRSSVLQIAAMLGYTPTPSSAATVSLSVRNNSSTASVTIPAKTQISSTSVVNGQSTQVTFETDSDLTLAASATGSVSATQGVTTTLESLGTSNGTPSQAFKISQTGVIINSSGSNIQVYVGGAQYTYSSSLVDNSAYDSVFTTTMDADGFTYILFGDGVSGKIPPATYTVTVTYRVGVGAAGNVAAGTLAQTFNGSYNVTVTQVGAATGGADAESTDSIRVNAPRALRTLRRAVSLKDYSYLALQVSGVSKANAEAAVWSNVNLYVAPFGTSATSSTTIGPSLSFSGVAITASDGTAGSGYLTYTASSGTPFSGLTANTSYVTITGAVPVMYNVYVPTLVTNVGGGGSSFTIATDYVSPLLPAFSTSGSSNLVISAVGTNTAAFNTLKSNVINYFTDKVAPNVSLTVNPPVYVPVNLEMTLHVLPQYNQGSVVTQVQNALTNLVSYNNSFFADRIPPHFILNAITNIDGVDYATVEHLRKNSNEQIYTVSSWSRTTSTATFVVPYTHSIIPGQNVRIYNVNAGIDGTYGVVSTTSQSITISVPTGSASATGVTVTSTTSPGATSLPVSSVSGISAGMYVTVPSVSSPFSATTVTVTSVGTSSINISSTVNNVIAIGSAVLFSYAPTGTDNYIKAIGLDSTTSAGITSYGVSCNSNEIPVKGTFIITATGGLS